MLKQTPDKMRWLQGFILAFGLHGIPLAWHLLSSGHTDTTTPAAAMFIELAPLPAAPVAMQTELPPDVIPKEMSAAATPMQPKQSELKDLSQEDIDTPETEQEDIPLPVLEQQLQALLATAPAKTTPSETTQLTKDTEQQEQQTAASVASSATAPAPSDTPADVAVAPEEAMLSYTTNRQSQLLSWHDRILSHLNQRKNYPAAARNRRQQGICYIRFSVNRDGVVLNSRLYRSSGYSELDNETLTMIRRAQPLPKPPADIHGEQFELVVPVEFFLQDAG